MKNLINKLIEKRKNKNYRYIAITGEVLPYFHDKFRTTNKDVELINLEEDHIAIIPEKQNDEIIKVHKDYTSHTGNPSFEINGVRQGDIYKVQGQGFLGNIDSIKEVFLVTNNYVFFKESDNGVRCYSHNELERMKSGNSLIQVNSELAV